MARTHSVAESQQAGGQTISDSDFYFSQMMDGLEVELHSDVYKGPGAFTLREIRDRKNVAKDTAQKWVEQMLQKKVWLKVKVLRQDEIGRWCKRNAVVEKAVYDDWNKDAK